MTRAFHLLAFAPALVAAAGAALASPAAASGVPIQRLIPHAPWRADGAAATVVVPHAATFTGGRAAARSWSTFVSGLVHGPELRTVRVRVATPAEVRRECDGGIACYDPATRTLEIPSEAPSSGQPLEEVVAHEYGHHIAASRSNPPWDSYVRGTKRWASYEDVCARARARQVFPGDEGARYRLNPGEGFAEAYRVLNGGRWSGAVDASFAPDAQSLAALRADVLTPWRRGPTIVRRGSATARFRLATVLDGTVRVALSGRGRVTLRDPATGRVLGARRATVCGQDAIDVTVRAPGRFVARVTLP